MNSVAEIAERFRQEPYRVLPMRYNCIGKSFRFRGECVRVGIKVRVVISLGIVATRRFGFLMKILMMHGWGEVNNERIEVARPLDVKSPWGTYDINLKPLIAIWL